MQRNRRRVSLALLLTLCLVTGWVLSGIGVRDLHAETDATYQELELFTDVLAIVRRSYVEEVPMKELMYGAIDGMLATLDPHTSFMPPELYKEMKIETKGEFAGLGIEVTTRDAIITVVTPIEDTPAFRVGMQAGDKILRIDDRFTRDLDIAEAVKLMRGEKGSTVTLTVMREGFEKPREFVLVREVIKVKSVKAKTLEDGFGYVRVTQFQERTAEDLDVALGKIAKENGTVVKGLVLDLRNNPGGLLDQAVRVSDLFLSSGLIVYTEGREEGSQMKFSAHQKGTEPSYPMVVLINGGSASAAEIVAGALQDQGRAVVLGTQSFGKGSVQTIIPLSDDSGLRLTTARYFTPKGTSIQARGIVPDIVVNPVEFKELEEPGHYREKDLRHHFEGEGQPAERGRLAEPSLPPRKFNLEQADKSDYQLLRALDLLKGLELLKKLPPLPAAA
ncbi:MAG: peptidase S41 [Desulfuromonadales bacterium GWD2_61_12]|nr:MAG: peptidase S41 [Desulfuromonadales bacterium GWC2_61_20]OGR34937.1 MAG: peptidase S41 [Desulfuromonadales bacterium GWD2_61_12]HAD04427.1 peptidase S41 [Desulfuromonas sp.]